MTYAIFDTGNLVVSYDDRDRALHALEQLVREDAAAAHDVAMIALDDAGHPVGDVVVGSERITQTV